jgi:hypothetical protein
MERLQSRAAAGVGQANHALGSGNTMTLESDNCLLKEKQPLEEQQQTQAMHVLLTMQANKHSQHTTLLLNAA